MICAKCHLHIAKGKLSYIVCNGLCNRTYHAVSPPNKNSFWLCDDCLNEFVKWRTDQKKADISIADSKSTLQLEVEELKTKVASIMSTLSANATNNSVTSVDRHSTPCSSSHLENGTRGRDHSGLSFTPDISSCLSDPGVGNGDFELLLTNIDGRVTESQIQHMVSRGLDVCETECKNVRKLVSRWIDCSTLDYVSFKVILDHKWKPKALKSSTWPANIRFREFVKRNCTWKPE